MKKAIFIVSLTTFILFGFSGTQAEIKSVSFLRPDTIAELQSFKERLSSEYVEKANLITNYYLIAQRSLYNREFGKALENINLSLNIHKNADLLAMKASIYYEMASYKEARTIFIEAFLLDENLPLPHLKGLKEWLKKEGLRK